MKMQIGINLLMTIYHALYNKKFLLKGIIAYCIIYIILFFSLKEIYI